MGRGLTGNYIGRLIGLTAHIIADLRSIHSPSAPGDIHHFAGEAQSDYAAMMLLSIVEVGAELFVECDKLGIVVDAAGRLQILTAGVRQSALCIVSCMHHHNYCNKLS